MSLFSLPPKGLCQVPLSSFSALTWSLTKPHQCLDWARGAWVPSFSKTSQAVTTKVAFSYYEDRGYTLILAVLFQRVIARIQCVNVQECNPCKEKKPYRFSAIPCHLEMLQDLCSERFQWADIPSRPTLTQAKFLPVIYLLFHTNGHNTAFSHTPFLLCHVLNIKSQMRQILHDKNALKIQVYYEALVVQRVFSLSLSLSQGLSIKEVGWA